MKVSLCVHSYNEGAALARLIRSSLPVADLIDEWVVVDHRSDDDTASVVSGLRDEVEERGIRFDVAREDRGLSRAFTFADIRNLTLGRCRNPIAVLMDADFLLCSSFRQILARSLDILSVPNCRYYGTGWNIPCVWDHLTTDKEGFISSHGRVWIHSSRARVLVRSAIEFHQTKAGGKWEGVVPRPGLRRKKFAFTNPRPHLDPAKVGFVSVNIKSAERIAMRDTMTLFMADAMQGRNDGEWVEQYRAGKLQAQGPYDFARGVDLRGWRLHSPDMDLRA